MKLAALLLVLLSGSSWGFLTWIKERNNAVAGGVAAYSRGNAPQAAENFAAALSAPTRRRAEPGLLLNLAHAQVQAGNLLAARRNYQRLLNASPTELASVARQQLAVLTAQRGDAAQALGLLRQALLLNPDNAGARYDYEILRAYLDQQAASPKMPSPPPGSKPDARRPSPRKSDSQDPQTGKKKGTEQQGETNDGTMVPDEETESQPASAGQADARRPTALTGNTGGARAAGAGDQQPIGSGAADGGQRGLDRRTGSGAAGGQGQLAGDEDATSADHTLQTQRERLQAMSLTPAQARQLLETMRAQEQQYLQQLMRPATKKPDPNKPTW